MYPTEATREVASSSTSTVRRDGETAVAEPTTGNLPRDNFMLALKLSESDQLFREAVGDERYRRFLGESFAAHVHVGPLCADPTEVMATTGITSWTARLLLTAEEDSRVSWLRDEVPDLSQSYSRAPSLRALLVMWRAAAMISAASQELRSTTTMEVHTLADGVLPAGMRKVKAPTAADVERIISRLSTSKPWKPTLCDLAALAECGESDARINALNLGYLRDVLRNSSHMAASLSRGDSLDEKTKDDLLNLFFVSVLLWRLARRDRHLLSKAPGVSSTEVNSGAERTASYSEHFFEATNQLSRIHHALCEHAHESTNALTQVSEKELFLSISHAVLETTLREVRKITEALELSTESPILGNLATWLLRGAPNNANTYRHVSRLVEQDLSAALQALKDSGKLTTKDLRCVKELIPLVEYCRNDAFFDKVMQEIVAGLENRLKNQPYSFTSDDFELLAWIGNRSFSGRSMEGLASSFDASAREQMRELQVMDGSPWALCVAAYRSLKEMIEGVLTDRWILKQQLQALKDAALDAMRLTEKLTTPTPSVESSAEKTTREPLPVAPMSASPALRHRFVTFLEHLVRTIVAQRASSSSFTNGNESHPNMVVSSDLFAYVNHQVHVPNIHDDYRRKIYLLVNVGASATTAEEQRRPGKSSSATGTTKDGIEMEDAIADIPAELRFLVSSLPLVFSPWACVMILREVLAQSAGCNPRYTYVLNAAIDLQLPMSTTRSRIATTFNMWRFLKSQSHKLSLKEQLVVKQRCVWNLPMSYILSSYWVLMTWLALASLVVLYLLGVDYESQLIANSLFHKFGPWPELDVEVQPVEEVAVGRVISNYLEEKEDAELSSAQALISSASNYFLGKADQQRAMTIISVDASTERGHMSECVEYRQASAVLHGLAQHTRFPFFVDVEKPLSATMVETRIAERMRRIAFNNTWFLPRFIMQTFRLGTQYVERGLISHTCAQANLLNRRITFMIYFHDGVAVTPQLIESLRTSVMAQHANLMVVVHERSLHKGGTSTERLQREASSSPSAEHLRVLPLTLPTPPRWTPALPSVATSTEKARSWTDHVVAWAGSLPLMKRCA